MSQIDRLARRAAAGAAIACLALSCAPLGDAIAAPKKPADAPSDSQPQASGRQSFEAGHKSFAAAKYQPAIDQLSTALRGGGLAGADMAKALYMRGVAYKKQGKPGLAISDLTSALWLKNGLSEGDRASATAERAEAYRMAGLGDGNSGSERIAVADPNTSKPAAAPTPAIPAPIPATAAAPAIPAPIPAGASKAAAPVSEPDTTIANAGTQTVSRQSPTSEAAQEAARARAAAAQPVDAGGLGSAAVATLVGTPAARPAAAEPLPSGAAGTPLLATQSTAPAAAEPAPSLAALPSDAPTSGSASPAPAAGNAIAGFFSNLFSGGTSQQTLPGQVTTASTATPAQEAQTSSWSDGTTVAERGSKTGKERADAVKVAAAAPAGKPAVLKGKYKVHIAAMRSRADADALAQKLTAEHGADLANRAPTVDEAVIGSMGTFYRVRVGGYASQEEPRGLCNKLRTSGFDCLVVTN